LFFVSGCKKYIESCKHLYGNGDWGWICFGTGNYAVFFVVLRGGFYGIVLAGVLFALIGYIVLVKVYSERIRNYEEFLFPSVGWVIGWIMEIMVTLFMGSVLCIMVAGAGSIISGALNIPYHYGTLIAAILCMIVFLTDIKGLWH